MSDAHSGLERSDAFLGHSCCARGHCDSYHLHIDVLPTTSINMLSESVCFAVCVRYVHSCFHFRLTVRGVKMRNITNRAFFDYLTANGVADEYSGYDGPTKLGWCR